LPRPEARGRDLLVRIEAVSINPIDTKTRSRFVAGDGAMKVPGYDAVGIVEAVGEATEGFAPGDRVWYAGQIDRPGSNAEYQLVDARIAAKAPASLSPAEAAALPLTSITAWEMLFDRLEVTRPVPGAAPAVLVIGGAGGVASMAIQILRAKTDLTVIATAGRPETADWVRAMGAHHVVDHARPLADQVAALGLGAPGHVFSTTATGQHLPEIARLIQPQGKFGLIDDPQALDIMPFKYISVSVHWETMFTRSLRQTPDIGKQGDLLAEMAALVDAGRIRSTMTRNLGPLSAAAVLEGHRLSESGRVMGKLVLDGFPG